MSESWPITENGTLVIRQDAPFDLRSYHKALFNWAQENHYDFNEKAFTEKRKSHGAEMDIDWIFEKEVTEFIKFKITLTNWGLGMNPTKDGKMQGKFETNIDSIMEMDWQNRWDTSSLLKFLRYLYIYYLKKQYFLNYAGKCWEDTYSLHSIVKTYFNQPSLFE